MKPLGKIQQAMLRALERNHGRWRRSDQWVWTGVRTTERILEGLVARGLVIKEPHTYKHAILKTPVHETTYKLIKKENAA